MLLLLACATLYIYYRRSRYSDTGDSFDLPPEERTFSADEVAKHDTADDLWLILDGKVYDFTAYYRLHPGGEAILRNAGKDSTEGFNGNQHPVRVHDMVSIYTHTHVYYIYLYSDV